MNSKIEVVSTAVFLWLVEGERKEKEKEKWRFVRGTISPYRVIKDGIRSSIVGKGKEVGIIKKVLIIPGYFENQLYGTTSDGYFELLSKSIQEQALEESDFLEDTSVLLVGECCKISEDTVERLRGLFPPIVFLTDCIGLNRRPFWEKAKLIADGLRSRGLMQKQETIWH